MLRPEKPGLASRSDEPVFKAVLIYENFAAGVGAWWFCQKLVRALDTTLQEQMWNFAVLGIRKVRNAAVSAARKADIVIVSMSGHTKLPAKVRESLDLCLRLLDQENPALVALFDSSAPRDVEAIRDLRSR